MSTNTVTLEPRNLAASAQSLRAEFARANMSGVKAVTAKGAVHIEMPIDGLAAYRFAYDHENCSWTKSKEKIVLQVKDFAVEQRTTKKAFLIVFRQTTAKSKIAAPKRPNQVREIFFQRSLRAIQELKSLDEQKLADAVQAPTDYSVLVLALSTEEALASIRGRDPLAGTRLRGLAMKRKLLEAEGGTLSSTQAARVLEISRQAVDKRRRDGKLLAVEMGKKGYRYPSWQFCLKGIEKVLAVLRNRDIWEQLSFFLNPSAALSDRTPLEELQRSKGNVSGVVEVAAVYGEQGG